MNERTDVGPVTQERYMAMLDYCTDLQQIIEDLCRGGDIKTPLTTARYHYNMATKYRAANSSAPALLAALEESFAVHCELGLDEESDLYQMLSAAIASASLTEGE